MVRLTIELRTTSPGEARNLLETLRVMTSTIRHEQGCHECSAWTDREFTVHYGEGWATEADVRRRVRSPAFGSVLALMRCGAESPDITFDFVTETRGLDYLEEIRAGVGDTADGRYQ